MQDEHLCFTWTFVLPGFGNIELVEKKAFSLSPSPISLLIFPPQRTYLRLQLGIPAKLSSWMTGTDGIYRQV